MKRFVYICSFGLLLMWICLCCQSSGEARNSAKAPFAGYTHIRYSFYKDSTGRLYERKSTFDGKNEGTRFDPYIRVWSKDSNWYAELGSILDTSTYEHVYGCDFSKDKNHVYFFFGMSDGGFRRIVEGADPKTFQCFGSGYRWGKDKQKIFYMYTPLSELNTTKAVFLNGKQNEQTDYISDGRVIYYTDNKLDSVDVESFKIIDSAGYTARDKRFIYQGQWKAKRK